MAEGRNVQTFGEFSVGVATGAAEDAYVPVKYEPDPTSPLRQYGTVAVTGEPAWTRERYRPIVGHWAVWLPHQCDDWIVAEGDRDQVLTALRQFRVALDEVIAVVESTADPSRVVKP